jgi:hypothetical protein
MFESENLIIKEQTFHFLSVYQTLYIFQLWSVANERVYTETYYPVPL